MQIETIKAVGLLLLLFGCASENSTTTDQPAQFILNMEDPWGDYWYAGKAEITVYDTKQFRYKDVHEGQTVLVQVTEDFLTDKQVKNDNYVNKNSESVLKTNLIQRFTTGIYDYSIMTSTFTPASRTEAIPSSKVTATMQDWCGHTFVQYNHKNSRYNIQQFSYFESEGDNKYQVNTPDLMEEEIFNRIRLSVGQLPTGSIQFLPSIIYHRFKHIPFNTVSATATLLQNGSEEMPIANTMAYVIDIPVQQRKLTYIFSKDFPHEIEGWIDDMGGPGKTSISKKQVRKNSPYWSQNSLDNQSLREELGLPVFND